MLRGLWESSSTVYGDLAPGSMVPSTMISMLGFNTRVATLFSFFHRTILTVRRFLTVYGSRFALTASGGSWGGQIIFLHLVGGNRVPNGITSGWDQVRMGSGEPSRVLFCFPALMENISRKLFFVPCGRLYCSTVAGTAAAAAQGKILLRRVHTALPRYNHRPSTSPCSMPVV